MKTEDTMTAVGQWLGETISALGINKVEVLGSAHMSAHTLNKFLSGKM